MTNGAKNIVLLLAIMLYGACWNVTYAFAQTLTSPNYKFEESSISNGGSIEANSSNYQTSITVGDTAIDNSSSDNFQVDSGSETSADPTLRFSVNGGVNFDTFSASAATVATSTFTVSNYTSYGYIVQVFGEPPSNEGHTIDPMTTTGPSVAGTEQFGINLVANTSPTSVGANPDYGDFGYGTVATNYATSNEYRYVSGETIASAGQSSGDTTYTISYIVNVEGLTPGGQYTSNQELICTATY